MPTLSPRTVLPPGLVWLLTVTTGLCVATMYYCQPLLPDIRDGLHLSAGAAGLLVSATQLGYVAGLAFVVPLGDLVDRRRLLPAMVAALGLCLVAAAAAPNGAVLLTASVAIGVLSVGAQVSVAFAATLAGDHERGRIVGTVMSGLLLGILSARTLAGYLAAAGGWRTPFAAAAVVMLILAVVLRAHLPDDGRRGSSVAGDYPRLLASVVTLLRQEPLLRVRAAYGAAAFGAFSALWTPLAFLLAGAPYHYPTTTVGLFGLLGLLGALVAAPAGRAADRGHASATTAVTTLLLLLAWIPIGLGRHHLAALIVGVLLLDLAVQGLHITNQSQIYRLRPAARSRVTAAYMTVYFIGGIAGSTSATFAYARGGWAAVSVVGAAFGALATALWITQTRRTAAPGPRSTGPDTAPAGRTTADQDCTTSC
ncbi:MFS transporter [Krasilnikovia sp. MM14-A1259]|uniref:MFS transporter n=1 Tax=Krasilnikovia sp. MM14-A1259 TaxID=3373539 RepID=UPI00381FD72D